MSAGVHKMQDAPGWAPRDPSRRRIEASDIAYASARRPRQGWQTIAAQLRVNAADLQRACEGDASLITQASERRAGAPTLKPGSAPARMLLAMAGGARNAKQVATFSGVSNQTCRTYVLQLKAGGFIRDNTPAGWPLTPDGHAEVAALKARGGVRG